MNVTERELIILDILDHYDKNMTLKQWYKLGSFERQLIMYKSICKRAGYTIKGMKFI